MIYHCLWSKSGFIKFSGKTTEKGIEAWPLSVDIFSTGVNQIIREVNVTTRVVRGLSSLRKDRREKGNTTKKDTLFMSNLIAWKSL